jgi:hypothetical protein
MGEGHPGCQNQRGMISASLFWPLSEVQFFLPDVRFSNRPFGVKHLLSD